jgi:hypothetical protein
MRFSSTSGPGRSLVVFCDAAMPAPARPGWRYRFVRWLLARLKPGFKHCFVVIPQDDGSWGVIDPSTDGLNWAHWPPMAEDVLRAEIARRGGTFLWARRERGHVVAGIGPVTCVTAVKAHLGRRLKAITPFQLYRHLAKEI